MLGRERVTGVMASASTVMQRNMVASVVPPNPRSAGRLMINLSTARKMRNINSEV